MLRLTLREPALAPAPRDPDRALDRARRRDDLRHVRLTGQIDRAFSEIFDAAMQERRRRSSLRTVSENNADGFPQPFPDSVLTRRAKVPGRGRGDGRDRRARLARHVQERHSPSASRRPAGLRRSCSRRRRRASRAGQYVARPRRARARRDRAARGHGRQGGRRRSEPTVGLVTLDGLKRLRVVGIYKIGTTASLGGALVELDPARRRAALVRLRGPVHAGQPAGRRRASRTPSCAIACARAVGARYKVQTGTEKAEADSKGIADLINGFLGPALLAFGGVAVLVGAFIIFNMFSITVAQRIREIAMLRTLGASRRQILTSVHARGARDRPLSASLIGIFAGSADRGRHQRALRRGRVRPAVHLAAARDDGRRSSGSWSGFGVTLVSALIPAVRATRIPPMAGLREGATLPRGRFARWSPDPRRHLRRSPARR